MSSSLSKILETGTNVFKIFYQIIKVFVHKYSPPPTTHTVKFYYLSSSSENNCHTVHNYLKLIYFLGNLFISNQSCFSCPSHAQNRPEKKTENQQGTRIKGREMTLVWHEKASRTALQTSSV